MWSVDAENIDNYSRQALLGMSSAWAQCFFSIFSTTTNPFRVQFRFSWPTRPLSAYVKAENIELRSANRGRHFLGWSPPLMLCMSTVFLTFPDNQWPLLIPVSIFRADLTPICLSTGQTLFALQIGYDDFWGRSPLLTWVMPCMSTVFLSFLDNHRPLSSLRARFNIPNQFNIIEFMQRPKTFCCTNQNGI
jgi:hypothetical protein